MFDPATAMVALRFVAFVAASSVFGTSLIATVADPTARDDHPLRRNRWTMLCASSALVAAVLWLRVEAALAGGAWQSVDARLMSTLALDTVVGHGWMLRTALALATVISVRLVSHRSAVVAATSGAMLASFAFGGHAVMDEGVRGSVHIAVDVLHLLAAGAWSGSLLPLASKLRFTVHRFPEAARAKTLLLTYSRAGHIAVTIVVLSGIANTVLDIGDGQYRLESPYVLVLLAKIVLVAVMIGFALRNRYRLTPHLTSQPAVIGLVRRAALAEASIATVVLGLAALLGTLSPA